MRRFDYARSMLIFTTICAALGIALLAGYGRRLHGTTLLAPIRWTLVAFSVLPVAAWVQYGGPENGPLFAGADGVRLIVAMATFCPAMAVLGAKRPQNSAWQFVVVSMWLVLSIPGLRAALLADGSPATLHTVPSWLLLALWMLSAANYLPTRFALSGLLVAVGQLLLAHPYLPLATWWPDVAGLNQNAIPVATVLFLVVAMMVCLRRPARNEIDRPLDRLWMDFRNGFGAVWGLRCQQRINQSAEMYGWPVRLDWHGFTRLGENEIDAELERAIRNNFANLLRRFVSPEWIAERVEEGPQDQPDKHDH